MAVTVVKEGGRLVLELVGDFRGTEESFAQLRQAAHKALAQCPTLLLDMTHVTFLDSQTLGLTVELLSRAQARGGDVALTGLTERTGKWFQLSGLDRILRSESRRGPKIPLPSATRRQALADVDIERMVSELQSALGDPAPDGAPSVTEPIDEAALSEIEKLLQSAAEEQD